MAEWSKAHAWKVCIRQRIEGSNPSFSANPKTFLIDQSRNVTLKDDYTNTRELEHARRQETLDADVIDFIKRLISPKPMNQSAIIGACKEANLGHRKPVMRVLRAYKDKHWSVERGFQNYELRYILIDRSP